MPFDGIYASQISHELYQTLLTGRIDKVYQPEHDELIIHIRCNKTNYKLMISANPSHPRVHITNVIKENPQTAPNFCMLLRKYLIGGKIVDISSIPYERIIEFSIENTSELGDLVTRKLVVEIMGKHSNIILINHENKILDSIKHIDFETSSVREVMPGRPYSLPPSQNKLKITDPAISNLFNATEDLMNKSIPKYLLSKIQGFSPILSENICLLSGFDSQSLLNELSENSKRNLVDIINTFKENILRHKTTPLVFFHDDLLTNPVDFYFSPLVKYSNSKLFDTLSESLDFFYSTRDSNERFNQKRNALSKTVTGITNKLIKKLSIYEENIIESSKMDDMKLFGELITANIWQIKSGVSSVNLQNYYSEKEEWLLIPLDKNLSPQENAQNYYKKYNKYKSTYSHMQSLKKEALEELTYLENVLHSLEEAKTPNDIDEIRHELSINNYVSLPKSNNKKNKKPDISPQPIRYLSSDGLTIFVGRNNLQNDTLTLKTAHKNDLWLHTKDIPGSHVIIRKGQDDIPSQTLYEASILAAYHSKSKISSKVPVDYTLVKYVKKPSGAKPGMVIYTNQQTVYVTPSESEYNKIQKIN